MKKVILFSVAILIAASGSAWAHPQHAAHADGMKMMDTNGDGAISKDEFMKHHEMMWDKMKKNSAGNVDIKDMQAMHNEMAAKHEMMMKDDKKK